MAERDFETMHGFRSRPSPRQFQRRANETGTRTFPPVQPDPLNRVNTAQPSQPGRSLLQLQRERGNRYVQRVVSLARAAEGEGDVMPDVERAIESRRGGGQSLDRGVQSQMGNALNADFSGVRVHTDAGADGLNKSLSAKAFTTGSDIYFRQGEYNPGSSSGRELLAHELTHVVQQNPDKVQTKSDDEGSQGGCTCGGSPAPGPQMKLTVSQPGDIYEQEADRIANAVMHQGQKNGASQAQSINRQIPEEEKEKLQGKYQDGKIARQMEEEEELPA
jgi:hypothetical protein